MSRLVIDASVAIKWFLPEPFSINALRLLDAGHELYAPDLIFPECGNVLWKKWLRQEIEAKFIALLLKDLGRMNLIVVPAFSLVEETAEIAISLRRSYYDSVYLALAKVSGARMVTADEKLCNALQGTSLADTVMFIGDSENV